MEEIILDQETNQDDNKFFRKSWKSLRIGLISLVLLIVLSLLPWGEDTYDLVVPTFGMILFLVMIISGFFSFFYALRSLFRKESKRPQAVVVAIMSALFIGLFLLVIIQNIIDILRVLN